MKLLQLKYFHEACRLNSISRAAESLYVSQPSISLAIKELEREFGVSLITRRYRGFKLTEEGLVFKDLADNLLRHANHVAEKMLVYSSQQKQIRFGVPPMVATVVLPTIYGEFRKQYPDTFFITEEMGSKTCIRNLRENALDMAFVVHREPIPSGFDSELVASTEIVWFSLPGHPLTERETISVSDLENEPLIFFSSGFSINSQVMLLFSNAGIKPRIIHTTSQFSTVRSFICNNIATGFMFRFVALDIPGIVAHPLNPPLKSNISLVWPKGGMPFPNKAQFITCCKNQFLRFS